jgi:hypothetical protein
VASWRVTISGAAHITNPFIFGFVEFKLISDKRQQSENVLHQFKLSCFEKCDTVDGFH